MALLTCKMIYNSIIGQSPKGTIVNPSVSCWHYLTLLCGAGLHSQRLKHFDVVGIEVSLLPNKPLRPCSYPGCPNLVESGYCERHKSQRWADNRKSARQRGYTTEWEKVRAMKLRCDPLCERCLQTDIVKAAVLVHHVKPISQGGAVLDMDNLMSVCRRCHSEIHSGKG